MHKSQLGSTDKIFFPKYICNLKLKLNKEHGKIVGGQESESPHQGATKTTKNGEYGKSRAPDEEGEIAVFQSKKQLNKD